MSETNQVVPAVKTRIEFIGNGCFRDHGVLYRDLVTGELFGLEWTPTLNPEDSLTQPECIELAKKCELLGGGWELPAEPAYLAALVNYDTRVPAALPELATDTQSDWYWTAKSHASTSGYAWIVYFGGGDVNGSRQYNDGVVRACRRFSPGQ